MGSRPPEVGPECESTGVRSHPGLRVIAVTTLLVATTVGACAADHAGASSRRVVSTTHPTKVLVVIEENHSFAEMKAGMPYLFGLSQRYGYASSWSAITHPSLPNYLAISGGSTFGVQDDRNPSAHVADVGNARSVFDQALSAGKSAKTYAESMPDTCHLTNDPPGKPSYAVRHNPWTYYVAGRTRCRANDVPLTGFSRAARDNALPNVGFLIPNLCNDAHNCSLATADAFLRRTLPDVLASHGFTSGRLAVVVAADEDDKTAGNSVLTSVLSSRLSHKVVTTHLTHYSLTRYIAQVLGVAPLGRGAGAPDMKSAFGL
jgi:hypothetical protein